MNFATWSRYFFQTYWSHVFILNLWFFSNHLDYLFRKFALIENQSVAENLNLGLIRQKLEEEEVRRNKQVEALRKANLSYIDLNEKIYTLSGSEA